jgi:glycosyltransferase involved in cell wall biosynthesis
MGAPPFQSPLIRYVGNSRFTAAAFERAFGWTPSVVPPIVVPERYKAGGKGHAVLHINPFPQKGIDITLDLATRRPDIPFIIIESWTINRTIAENYYATARRLPNVEWKKSVSDMSKIYAQARVVIAPSRYHEGWGRIATEAQVSGIPVLASARGGLPEAVGPGGLLVDPDAPIEAWEKSLAQVWDDPTAYAAFREAALEHSRRREIQKDHLIAALERELLQLTGTSTP